METTTTEDPKKKSRVLKLLAVGGVIALAIILIWLGIKLVGVVPRALSSLASLADTVYNHEEVAIKIDSTKDVANVNESFNLMWNKPKQNGIFTFTYTCTDGVSIDIRGTDGQIKPVTCGVAENLGDVSNLELIAHSEKARFTDIPYVIAFVPTNATIATASTPSTMTVLNPSISANVAVNDTPTPVVTTNDAPKIDVPAEVEPTSVTPKTPVTHPTATPATQPVTTQYYTYAIPVSNPNGFTDLTVKVLSIGTINNGAFITNNVIYRGMNASLLFEIKNIGTKTSTAFTYTVAFPNGTSYTSPLQEALKPNERASIAMSLDVANTSGVRPYSVSVENAGESIIANNSFRSTVLISN